MYTTKRVRKTRGLKLYLFVLLLCLLTFHGLHKTSNAASQGMKELIEGAKSEGELIFYASMNITQMTAVIDAYEKKYPFVKVKPFRTGGVRLLTRILAETRAKKLLADAIQTLEFNMHAFKERGILGHYPSTSDRFYPKDFKEEGYWATAYLNPYVVCYNNKLVIREDIPKTYEDLLNPRWKGKMMMNAGKVDWFAGMLQIMGKENGLQFMRELSKQNIVRQSGHELVATLVAAGEAELDINIPVSPLLTMKKRGAPLDWVALGTVPGVMVGVGINSQALHPNAAKLYKEFMLSKEGQNVLRRFGRMSARSDMVRPKVYQGLQVVPVNPALAGSLDEYAKIEREIFSK
ncbi:ABC transporter substrate-binding protein [Thermodesulfobacteriota bacterium]